MAKDSKSDVETEVPTAAETTVVTDSPAPAASEPDPIPEAPEPKEFRLSVVEACARISATDKRVEMIGAFHASEKAAGRLKDFESAYRERYAAFCNAPA